MTTTLTRRLDLDRPPWRCARLFVADGPVFLLDSAQEPGSGALGRWTFTGGRPCALLTAKRRRGMPGPRGGQAFLITLTTWRRPDGAVLTEPERRTWSADPFSTLRQLQEAYATEAPGDPAVPFTGGLVGWLGYEAGHALENLPDTGRDDQGLPDLAFLVADEVLAHDHETGVTSLTVTGRGDDPEGDAEARFAAWNERLAAPDPGPRPAPAGASIAVGTTCDRVAYGALVERCRQHILAGDVFEVCLTHRLEAALRGDPWRLYEILRQIDPAPFATFLDLGDHQLVSASPERFLGLTPDRLAETRPIKGTRPRGADPVADEKLKRSLAMSEKDKAENIMIVDLARNDLGRVCELGSVHVPELLVVESYATVHQLVSTIRGRLRDDHDAFDLVAACFPGGSMTGAPKIAAMGLIDRYETWDRGPYSGAVGYFDRSGGMDLNIVIRTAVCAGGRATVGIGGAVTADSDPDAEYDESLDKGKALLEALGRLGMEAQGDDGGQ
ncbi:MAG: aminodeoxychorismate synthase component I [bacterium]|nr:aminodeoxychorismate synthase component I [bacterium]